MAASLTSLISSISSNATEHPVKIIWTPPFAFCPAENLSTLQQEENPPTKIIKHFKLSVSLSTLPKMSKTNWDIATKAQVVTLKALKMGNDEITRITGVGKSTIHSIYDRALERGFKPGQAVKDEFVEHSKGAGRPKIQDAKADEVLQIITRDKAGREKTCAILASESLVSASTVWRILKSLGMRKTKPTRKPGLTKKMKDDRLAFCKAYEHWTLEDWKAVIWSDETSVVVGQRRGSLRVWRRPWERFNRSCIRPRWKGYSDFMFWGCFSYDMKGPCHIWRAETKKDREAADKVLEKMNKALEPEAKAAWEMETGIRRLNITRNPGGRKPTWKWNARHGKLSRSKKGGIDWFRYQREILTPKLIPFAKQLQAAYPDYQVLVQEDKAPSHSHHFQQSVFDANQVQRLLWPGNSPDLNMIEPCWPHLKRETTSKGAPGTRPDAEKRWNEAWRDLEQERIQAWIRRIVDHIQQVIKLEGGNEYPEGRHEAEAQKRPGRVQRLIVG
jgi:transposase